MTIQDLAPFLMNNLIHVSAIDHFKYEFHYKHQIFGYYCFDDKLMAPYVKNICWDRGIMEYEPHDWMTDFVQ